MTDIIRKNKPLAVSPLKASQPVGAALAFLGIQNAMPMFHGSQGCTAFAKVFFVRHFRDPIPLQTTALDQVSTVMNPEDNVVEGLRAIASKSKPALIGVPTTGLAETQGSDIHRAVREFRQQYPEFNDTPVVAVNTPDFTGCLETGYAAAVTAMIDVLVPDAATAATRSGKNPKQINVLMGSMLTPGDGDEVKALLEQFGFTPVLVPDVSDSLDGHLVDADYSPLTLGGTPVSAFSELGNAVATLVIGDSLHRAADLLKQRTGVPDYRFSHLLGLKAMDALTMTLHELSGQPVPALLERDRNRLQDAMVDCHFMLGLSRIGVAADADLLVALSQFLAEMGAETVAAVSAAKAESLEQVAANTVQIGDLDDLERLAREQQAQLIITNSHGVETAKRLGVPLLRAGFPLYDQVGASQRRWVGYSGSRQIIFDLANLLLDHHQGIAPYRSVYGQKRDDQEANHASATPFAPGGH